MYTFKQICNFKAGESYWECSQYGSIHFTIKKNPDVTEDEVNFIGVTTNGDELSYTIRKGYEHYGPKLYDFDVYAKIT